MSACIGLVKTKTNRLNLAPIRSVPYPTTDSAETYFLGSYVLVYIFLVPDTEEKTFSWGRHGIDIYVIDYSWH